MAKKISEYKKYIRKRVSEIIQDYLYDDDESYARIDMYFETKDGRNQHKTLSFGSPSSITPDEFREFPEGYLDVDDHNGYVVLSGNEILIPQTFWFYDLECTEPWDGKTLSQIRQERISIDETKE